MPKTQLMAILNVTPDSFYINSRFPDIQRAIDTALTHQSHGADILDIGGESSRPGAPSISETDELERVIPVIQSLKSKLTIPISIDTVKPRVAAAAIEAGAVLINDINGFNDPEMIALAADKKVDICLMHMQGSPRTMQMQPYYPEGIIPHLLQWFERKCDTLIQFGVDPKKIILDPGIGFGKTIADNLQIIHNLPQFKRLGFRVLLGISRKSFLSKILNKPPEDLLAATLAINAIALTSHIDFIRVHDVKEHRDIIDLVDALEKKKGL